MTNFETTGGFLGFLVVAWAFAFQIFWMIVGWRAMRAHERLAASVDEATRR